MVPDSLLILAHLAGIEAEMRRIGFWQKESLKPEQYQFQKAFGMDRMSFGQWLQFIFIPHAREAAEMGNFPKESHVGAQAMREFDGIPEAARLTQLLSEFDSLF
jgi:uncharacterized protein YqcC (DUF446 family)